MPRRPHNYSVYSYNYISLYANFHKWRGIAIHVSLATASLKSVIVQSGLFKYYIDRLGNCVGNFTMKKH